MIYIKELLPNPTGKDANGEWIKLFNDSSSSVVLNGWSLKDASWKSFQLESQTILPSGDLKLSYNETRISLNNDTDSVYLYDASGNEVDKLCYSGISEGQIVTAVKFQTKRDASATISSATQSAPVSGFNFQGAYDLWPIVIGLSLATLAGIVGVHIFKTLSKNEN